MKPNQESECREHEKRLDHLRRVKKEIGAVGPIDWHAGILMAEIRKMHTEPTVRFLSPAATGGEASLPSECLSECDRGSKCVCHLPKRQPVPADQDRNRDKPADKS